MQRKNVFSLQLNMRFTQTCDVWKFAMFKNLYFHKCSNLFFVPEPLWNSDKEKLLNFRYDFFYRSVTSPFAIKLFLLPFTSHCSTQNIGFSDYGYVIKPPQPSSAFYRVPDLQRIQRLSTVCSVSSPRGALVSLALKTKLQASQIETWNTINQWSFCQFLKCQAHRTNAKPPYWKHSAAVLRLLFIRPLSIRSPILPKWNNSLYTYVRSGMASSKLWVGQMFDFRRATVFCLRYCLFLKHKMTRYSKYFEGPWLLGTPWLRLCMCGLYNVYVI